MNNFHSVSDSRYMDKILGTANRNRSYEVYKAGKPTKDQDIDLAFEEVESELLLELELAKVRSDVHDELYTSLRYVISQYDLNIEPEDVLPYFWKQYKLKD